MPDEPPDNTPPRVFISYSWDSDEHKLWVKSLATQLRDDGIDARLDAWHLEGRTIPSFMTSEVRNADIFLAVCTRHYRNKIHALEDGIQMTGSGWETQIATNIQFASENKVIVPILANGTWPTAAPDFIAGLPYFDFSQPSTMEANYGRLLTKLLGRESKAPPLGTPPEATDEAVPPLLGNKSLTPSFSVEVENDVRLIGDFERICALVITNVGENELSDCLVQIERFNPKQSELAMPFVLRTEGQLEGDRSDRFRLSVSQPKNVPLLFRRSTRKVEWYLIDENGKSHFVSPSDMRLDVGVYGGRNNAKFPVTIRLVSDWDAHAKIEDDSYPKPTNSDPAPMPPKHDKWLVDAVHYVATGSWDKQIDMENVVTGMNKSNQAIELLVQWAADGDLTIWGKGRFSGPVVRIEPDYWVNYGIHILRFFAGGEPEDLTTEHQRGQPSTVYRSLKVTSSEVAALCSEGDA